MREATAKLALGLLRARLRWAWAVARRAPLTAAGIAGGAAAFYAVFVAFALPRLGWPQLRVAVDGVFLARGEAAHLSLAAAVHLAVMVLCAAPVGLQLASESSESDLTRLFWRTVRAPRPIALALLLEACVSLSLFVDGFLFPLTWWPFLPRLSGGGLLWLFSFKLAATAFAALLALLFAAVSLLWGRSRLARGASWLFAGALALAPLVDALRARSAPEVVEAGGWLKLVRAAAEAGSVAPLLGVGLVLWLAALGPGTRALAACLVAAEGGEARLGALASARCRPPPRGPAGALARLVWLQARLWASSPWRVLFLLQTLVLFALPSVLRFARGASAVPREALSEGFLVLLSAIPALAVVNGATVITEPATLPLRWERGATLWGAVAQTLGQALPVQLGFAAVLAGQVLLGTTDGPTAALMGLSLAGCGLFLGFLLQALLSWAYCLTQSRTALGLLASGAAALAFGGYAVGVLALVDPFANPTGALAAAGLVALALVVLSFLALAAVAARAPRSVRG